MANGDVRWWSSNGGALFVVKKRLDGSVKTNLVGLFE
jgi:hypothetical protein